ncbi:TonB-dependent siderophore receptor [Motilimonas pumila]|uniref:TonB-dependent siderophore receptor n=1 Tax=Motilimonas pumila TaxID=2303987 RepID=A0A418YAH2_9GAMM|nr:TonB-dependent siderophore receptor [Motilimonas pumila]RJG39977.1 TonB-dependent siderophore receptor [Motilimonas pumila]
MFSNTHFVSTTSRPLFAKARIAVAISSVLFAQGVYAAEEAEDVMVVESQKDADPVGPGLGYVGMHSLTATKTDTELRKVPRAVSVVTREHMDDRASISIADALQYTPSIQSNYYGEDNKQDWFVIRGFKQANAGLYQDNTRIHSEGFYSYQVDPFGLERVEILRGPASVLYGQNPPGGVINVVSKRPNFNESIGFVEAQYGTDQRIQLSLDIGSQFNDNAAWRLVAMGRTNETRIDGLEAERYYVAPSFAFKFAEQTELTLLTSYQRDDSDPYLQFLPAEGSLVDNENNGKISDSTAIGNPGFEKFERSQLNLGYELTHAFNEQTSFAQSARYSNIDIDLVQMYALGYSQDILPGGLGVMLDPTRSTIMRGVSTEEGDSDSFNIDNRLVHKLTTGSVDHVVLAGIDYQYVNTKGLDYAGGDPIAADANDILMLPTGGMVPNPTFNPFNPEYTDNVMLLDGSTFQPVTEADRVSRSSKKDQLGFYLQNQMTIQDAWVVNLGARYDIAETKMSAAGSSSKVDDKEWTGSIGTAYLFDNGLTPYASYANYFQPILQWNSNGEPAKPETGDQFELGIKYQPVGFDGQVNAAYFVINKENLASRDGLGNLTQIGEIENKGFELEFVANVTASLSLVANATFMDPKITKNQNESTVGKRPVQVADTLASAWAHYRFLGTSLDGLAIGGGARYVGDTYGDNNEMIKVPSYTLFDATASYEFSDYKVQVAVKNIADKEYVATCYGSCFYGDRRNVIASLSYAW